MVVPNCEASHYLFIYNAIDIITFYLGLMQYLSKKCIFALFSSKWLICFWLDKIAYIFIPIVFCYCYLICCQAIN